MTLGYHNHAFEFNKLPSGKMPMECILDHNENLKYEIDLGWVLAGKADPIFWIKKYASRIKRLQVLKQAVKLGYINETSSTIDKRRRIYKPTDNLLDDFFTYTDNVSMQLKAS